MLFKNGERYTLTKKDGEEIRNAFKKFPVIVKYDSSLVKMVTTDVNTKETRSPAAVAINLKTMYNNPDGVSEEWIYAENTRRDRNGDLVYLPTHILVDKTIRLDNPKDLELLFYLWRVYPNIKDGLNENGSNRNYFEFVNEERAAVKSVEAEKPLVYVKYRVLDDDTSDEYLNRVAKALFISDVDDKSRAEIQRAIINQFGSLPSDKIKEKVKYFKEVIESEEKSELLVKVQEAIDLGKIGYDISSKKWFYFSDEGIRGDEILRVLTGDPNKRLVDHLVDVSIKRDEFIEYVDGGKKPRAKNKKTNTQNK